MPGSKAQEFEEFSESVANAVAWNRGVGFEWKGQALLSAGMLEELTRLAFEAPKARRDVFVKYLAE